MVFKHSSMSAKQEETNVDTQSKWLSWCRLCGKREQNGQENSSIFMRNDAGKLDSELATSIGKYFWVNIKADDTISKCICIECRQLIEELVAFTERVNKVQTLFCLLQNIRPTTSAQADQLRTQCGLIDEGWQHIIKARENKVFASFSEDTIDTETIDTPEHEHDGHKDIQTSMKTEEIINILRKSEKNEDFEFQTEGENENVYEYVVHGENEAEYLDNSEYAITANEMCKANSKDSAEDVTADEDDVQDIHLFKELKYKINSDDDNDDSPTPSYKIDTKDEEVELEFQESTQSLQDDDLGDEEIEMLEEEDNDPEYIDTSESHDERRIEALALLKGKRGRPFGTKNSRTNESPYRFDCKECKRTYKNPNIFRRHMSSLHNICVDDLPDFKSLANTCEVCNKQFLTRSSLKLHMRHHLPDEEKYNVPCPYCDRKFSQVGAMRQHVNGIHHQMKPFICDQCGRACKTMAALNEHQLVHTNECPFECEVCHKRFKNKPRLKSHMDTHNKSVYKCEDCGLELNTKRTLLQHRLVHSDVKRFKCEFCDAAFKRSKALKNHLILHSGLRPYKCNFCNKSFSNGSNCRAHKKRAHPKELAEEEATGKEKERVPIPKLEELKSAKGVLVQPRKVKRHNGGLPHKLRKLLESSESYKQENSNDCDDAAENYESLADFHYEICKSEMDGMVDNPNEECEETVIYEIIDEI